MGLSHTTVPHEQKSLSVPWKIFNKSHCLAFGRDQGVVEIMKSAAIICRVVTVLVIFERTDVKPRRQAEGGQNVVLGSQAAGATGGPLHTVFNLVDESGAAALAADSDTRGAFGPGGLILMIDQLRNPRNIWQR
jgi:hypothetical protein